MRISATPEIDAIYRDGAHYERMFGPGTIEARWTGECMDYSMAIDALIAAREREQQKTAPDA